jgi:3',5'-nucleoside bisphosphate phosphatase
MQNYKADLHIHSVLSPCGDLEMSPKRIVEMACLHGIDILAVTDHNATHHGPLVRKLAEPYGITVLYGAEVTSKEEVHLVCLFEHERQRLTFQEYIDEYLPVFPNNPERFGFQVVVNEQEEIIQEIETLLTSALGVGVNAIERQVHQLGGLFIPAHVDRPRYSLTSQLGFVPSDLNFDALELSINTSTTSFQKNNSYLNCNRFIRSSDAHYPNDIAKQYTNFIINEPTIVEMRMALWGLEGRRVEF